jgi:antitoxin (DNA-binding transcriptional repressor) of toxin-antitoxin stability system
LIARVDSSGGFMIAKAGTPIAKVVPLIAPDAGKTKRLGFIAGQLRVPAQFDRRGEKQIDTLFGGVS